MTLKLPPEAISDTGTEASNAGGMEASDPPYTETVVLASMGAWNPTDVETADRLKERKMIKMKETVHPLGTEIIQIWKARKLLRQLGTSHFLDLETVEL